MARGWESKAVEAQQEEASRVKRQPAPPSSPKERARVERRRLVELARRKATADLRLARSPAHRASLEQAISDLDRELGEL